MTPAPCFITLLLTARYGPNPHPAGTSITISKVFSWADCQSTSVSQVSTREALLAGGGDTYYVDANGCLHLKLTDPGHPWLYSSSFQREGLSIEETVGPAGAGCLRCTVKRCLLCCVRKWCGVFQVGCCL